MQHIKKLLKKTYPLYFCKKCENNVDDILDIDGYCVNCRN